MDGADTTRAREILAAQLAAGLLANSAYNLTRNIQSDAAFSVQLFRAIVEELEK